jgi:ribosomal protein L31E
MAKETFERTYNVPLRKEFLKVARWKRTKKAIKAFKEFIQKHAKSENVVVSKEVNEYIWRHGIKNPPHHVKVNVTKDEKGAVKAELFKE